MAKEFECRFEVGVAFCLARRFSSVVTIDCYEGETL